jgi:RimJ/RimL family protein N-acetyltransferase
MEKGEARMYKIVADSSDEVHGTIGIWRVHWKEAQAYEMGWCVLPEHQGKGVATEAARLMISQARFDPGVRYVHAFPTVSNTIARKIGMENQYPFDNEGFAGVLRCNDWRIDLR